jgi:hypothetical protein
MKTYRIYTEDINREKIVKIISNWFDGFTLFEGTGYWNGINEAALVIEIIAEDEDMESIAVIAKKIKSVNRQESVLVSKTEVNFI